MILILSGPTRSYKTTTLLQWIADRKDCGGVLSPDVNGLRQLYQVKEKKGIAWQKHEADSPSDIVIGRFVFDGAGFAIAESWLNKDLDDVEVNYLILDEVGPLELNGKGWDSWLRMSLQKFQNKTLILVVRDTLLEEVIKQYSLDRYEVVTKEYFVT